MTHQSKSQLANVWRWVLATALTLTVIACRDQNLSRSAARELLAHSSRFTPAKPLLNLASGEVQCGHKEGLWRNVIRKRDPSRIFDGPLELTPKGQVAFEKISPSYSKAYAATLSLKQPYVRHVIEVTGIADYAPPLQGWTGKEGQFTWSWQWEEFPDTAKVCLSTRVQTGTAIFRHYDDGWRLEEILDDK